MKKKKTILTSGKRKTAVARAIIRVGTGTVMIDSTPLELYEPALARMLIKEPLTLAGGVSKEVDIFVKAKGGGVMSRAEATRMAIAKGLVEWAGEELRKKFIQYDRSMLVYDPRRKEAKKPLGPGARRKKQMSKR